MVMFKCMLQLITRWLFKNPTNYWAAIPLQPFGCFLHSPPSILFSRSDRFLGIHVVTQLGTNMRRWVIFIQLFLHSFTCIEFSMAGGHSCSDASSSTNESNKWTVLRSVLKETEMHQRYKSTYSFFPKSRTNDNCLILETLTTTSYN